MSASLPDALAAQILSSLRDSLSVLRAIQQEASRDLYAGAHAQAGARLKRLFSGWSEFLQAVRDVLPALEPGQGEGIQQTFARTASHLSGVHRALSRRDWVETADLLAVEGEGLLDTWSEALAAPPVSPAQ